MGKLGDYFAAQCGNPRGIIGKIMTWGMNRANNIMYHGIIDNMNLSYDMKVLDIGFGNGYLEKLIYKQSKCSIYGIDISEDMVAVASKANRKGIENGDIHLEIGDCCNLLYQDATFDVVMTMNTIYFWKDTIKGLTEIYRVLKAGGKFYNAVLTKESLDKVFYTKNGFKKFTEDDYIKLGQEVGFRNITCKELGNEYGILIIYEK